MKGNTMKKSLILSAAAALILVACNGEKKTADVALSTIQCGMCSMNIENALSDLKGFVSIEIDDEKKVGKVVYEAGVLDMPAIENAIAAIGYDANDTPANKEAYAKLDMCCKVPGKE